MKRKRDLPRSEWPEAKIADGNIDSLSDVELLATFIGSGVKGTDAKAIAKRLLTRYGSRLLTASPGDLSKTKGIGDVKAAKMVALFELACRLVVGASGSELAKNLAYVSESGIQLPLIKVLARRSPQPDTSHFTHIEFFAGIGLVRYALERRGWTLSYANDIDDKKKEMYVGHFGDDYRFDLADIHTVKSSSIPHAMLATASFPCTDLSLAGARRGLAGKQSSVFWQFVRIIEEMGEARPPIIMIENVPGFLSSHGGADLKQALLALNGIGYQVDAFVIDAARFLPQSRKRLFIVGVQSDEPVTDSLTAFALADVELRPPALAAFISRHSEIRWRLNPLPELPVLSQSLADIVEHIPETAKEWWSQDRTDYLLSQMSDRHRDAAKRMMQTRKWSYGTVFRRVRHGKCMAELRTDGLAGCLRTPKGGSAKQILFKAGYAACHARLLTPRECARLMGADDFAVKVKADQALFGFGDAVCVPVIEWIAEHYLNPLAQSITDSEYPSKQAVVGLSGAQLKAG